MSFDEIPQLSLYFYPFSGLLIEKVMNTMRNKAINDQDPRKVIVYSTVSIVALLE